jgi:hypothetical protein
MIGLSKGTLPDNTHTHNILISTVTDGFEPAIPANKWPYTNVFNRASIGIDHMPIVGTNNFVIMADFKFQQISSV